MALAEPRIAITATSAGAALLCHSALCSFMVPRTRPWYSRVVAWCWLCATNHVPYSVQYRRKKVVGPYLFILRSARTSARAVLVMLVGMLVVVVVVVVVGFHLGACLQLGRYSRGS